jgi:translation initiation factor 3 subunit D
MDTLKNNTYQAQQELNKKEYQAKNRRYKELSLDVP